MDQLLKSKRFWVAVASLLAIVLKDRVPVTEEQLQQIVLIVAALIVGDSVRAIDPSKELRSGR